MKINNSLKYLLLIFIAFNSLAIESDKQADFIMDADNFKNLPVLKDGETQMKLWGNVLIEQGTLKIKSDKAIVFNGKEGISKVVLTGTPVIMEQVIDKEFGKIDVKANRIDFMQKKELLIMTGNVVINSKIQGEMSGEKITMNLKTNEIKGVKSETGGRVRLVIKPKSKQKIKK